ncbi:MAG: DUF86 domain-containing protein [Myxococcales bacterium]|nr:DUF86 domain-containing protein [Myxococcales bacterium]
MTFEELQSKLDVLKANLDKLERIPQASYEEFACDFRNVDSTLHILQTSIQALVDLGSWLVAERALATPRTSHEIFERLEEAGALPAGGAKRFAPLVGFRNRVVHLYDRIDTRRVYEVLTLHRRDLAELLDALLAAAEATPGAEP